MSNKAAWIKQEKARLVVDEAETPTPGANELLVKNAVIALNPVEAKIQKLAIFPLKYPSVLGGSFAGTVQEVGSAITGFKVGDRVAVKRSAAIMPKTGSGAFQQYVLADPNTTSKLEDKTSLAAGAAAILNMATSVTALHVFLKLDRPSPAGVNPANEAKKILVYGGSSSVGGFAVLYAVRNGYTVITTSSPKNASTVSSLGPAKVIDHTQPSSAIVSELKEAGPYDAVFDSIGSADVSSIIGQVLQERGGVFYTSSPLFAPLELPANVERRMESYPLALENSENAEFGRWFYATFGQFLATGATDALLAPEKLEQISGGLEGIQSGLDKLIEGVSGKKLIVEL